MAGITVQLQGITRLREKLRSIPGDARLTVKATLYQFAEEVMSASKQIVPVKYGALMNSGKVMQPVEDGDLVTVTLGYGDESSDYALYVHEALEGPHEINPNWSWAKAVAAGKTIQWTRPGSGPKYLERPLKEMQGELPGRIKDAVKEMLKK